MARISWNFFDGTTTYDLPVNPDSATMPTIEKVVGRRPTAAGRQVLYEGLPSAKTISFSGVILEEEQFRAFQDWFEKNKQIRVTDDLGMVYWVLLTSFSPSRVRDVDHPWHMTYSASGITLDRG